MTITEKLSKIQKEMKAPKNLYNSFGKYAYRNAEGILEAFKPFEEKYNVMLVLSDTIEPIRDRYYVRTVATLMDCESNGIITATAYAREPESKKGMDESQITGATSSYARKYALNGLFLLDDTKDADTDEYRKESDARAERDNKKRTETKAEAAANQKMVEDGNVPIDAIKVTSLKDTIKKKGLKDASILGHYKLEAFEQMTTTDYIDAMNLLARYKDI